MIGLLRRARAPRRALCALAVLLVVTPAAAAAAAEASVDANQGRLLTSLVANAAAADARFDVLTRDDVRNAIAVEAEKQSTGCSASTCLAELAGAMGARVVVYGTVGRLGDELLLTLNLFDSDAASSGGRRVVHGADVNALGKEVEPATKELLASFVKASALPDGNRVRLLVLDLEVQPELGGGAAPPPPAPSPSLAFIVGGAVGALGVIGLGVGGVFDALSFGDAGTAAAPATTQKTASALAQKSDDEATVALFGYGAGVVGVAVGVGVLVAGMVLE